MNNKNNELSDEQLFKLISDEVESVEVPEELSPERIENLLNLVKDNEAKKIEVPEELLPENIEEKLELVNEKSIYENKSSIKNKWNNRKKVILRFASMAAVMFIMAGTGIFFANRDIHDDFEDGVYVRAKNNDELEEILNDRLSNRVSCLESFDQSQSSGFNYSSEGENYYTQTNTIEKNVDEADVVKTDGEYIYRAQKKHIYIVKADNGAVEVVSSIKMKDGDYIDEIFVDNDRLIVLSNNDEITYEEKVTMYTYDISNKLKPKLTGEVTVDGKASAYRKVGNYVYIFTDYNIQNEKKLIDNLPKVNGERIDADCIYVGNYVSSKKVCVSVNIRKPNKVSDKIMVVGEPSNVYMGEKAFYIYSYTKYDTRISKFVYNNGRFNAKATTLINGEIKDQFAISERDGKLRVLTTKLSKNNNIYIYDDNLKLLGELTQIAPGESVYAARYVDDLLFFVTYRKTDQLFVADISDSSNPKILGELNITGYSDYLHVFDDDHILGIGYETNENNYNLGVKLCMFDVSDKSNPKLAASLTNGGTTSQATSNYKSVLVNLERKQFGLTLDLGNGEVTYKVYGWENNDFEELLSVNLKELNKNFGKEEDGEKGVRGLYIGDYLYIVTENNIYTYDADDNFIYKDSLEFDTLSYVNASRVDNYYEMTDETGIHEFFEINNYDELYEYIRNYGQNKALESITKDMDFEKEVLYVCHETEKTSDTKGLGIVCNNARYDEQKGKIVFEKDYCTDNSLDDDLYTNDRKVVVYNKMYAVFCKNME